jgi:hypothetical protein
MPDARWTLWVFAGPGALAGPTITPEGACSRSVALGVVPSLGELLGGRTSAPELVAELVGEPTILQQLTSEWPAQRWSAGTLDAEPAQRDLAAFVAWASSKTPAGSRRALIVLGDLLRACGEAPEAMVGGYRPTYPTQIKVKKPSSTDTYTKNAANNDYAKAGASGSYTVVQIGATVAANDGVNFENEATWYRRTSATSNAYAPVDASGNAILDKDRRPLADATIDWTAAGVALTLPVSRGLDATGSLDVDLATRRIEVLADALAQQRVDLLVSEGSELVRVAALRRLAPQASVLVGPRCSDAWAGHGLLALLDALAATPDAEPEPLANAMLDAYADRLAQLQRAGEPVASSLRRALAGGHELVALRSAGAGGLLAELDGLAAQVLADASGSPASHCVSEACHGGGDLAGLLDALQRVAEDRRRALVTSIAATTIGRRVIVANAGSEASSGIELDGPGLALGPTSSWTRLLDRVAGRSDAELVRRTIAEVRRLEQRPQYTAASPASPLCWLEYRPAAKPDLDAAADFAAFLATKLREPGPRQARHLALVVRGARTRGASIALTDTAALSLVQLARALREALAEQRRGPLALLVFDDPQLLALELAYELRDVASTLVTGTSGPPSQVLLEARVSAKLVRRCEQQAADALAPGSASSIAAVVAPWRREVAAKLALQLIAPDQDLDGTLDVDDKDDDDDGVPDRRDLDDDDDGVLDKHELAGELALQAIDLRHMEALCRRFGRMCALMFENLDDPTVLEAVRLASSADNLIELINRAQMLALVHGSAVARDIYLALGDVYNWISGRADAIQQAGVPFWLDPRFVEDRSPGGYATRLRISTAPWLGRDHRELAFHRDVCLHALLTAARVLEPATQKLWRFVSLGLSRASDAERRDRLGALGEDPDAATYFDSLARAPLLSLDAEPSGASYELSLASSLSTAVLVRRRNAIDLDALARSLEGLGYVLSRGAASRAGWAYVESLGACLAEDLLQGLDDVLERERLALLDEGHSRAPHLALALPRELMRFPWELMRLPARAPGQASELLAARFALGRQMWSDRAIRRIRRDDRIRVLIVADPRTSAAELPGARAEGEAIRALCSSMARELGHGFAFECDASLGETLTRADLRRRVREGSYDVLHFAGHAQHRADAPEQSGWLLSDGLLSVTELRNTLEWTEQPPWLIFANACGAGMVEAASPYQGEVHGMAEACIRAGVNAFVAPLWKVHDESARMLASEFYRRLLLEHASVGVALQQARIHVGKAWASLRGDAGLADISWAGMVLFGNPTERL